MDTAPTIFEFSEEFEKFKEKGRFTGKSNHHVAIYGVAPDGSYTYVVYSWDLSDFEFLGEGYWSCTDKGGIYAELSTVKQEAERSLLLAGN